MKRENTKPDGRQENIDDILYDSLENFEVTPSMELKKRIIKDMFFVNIVRYHLLKLIGGFAGIVAISVISVYLYNVSSLPANKNLSADRQVNKNELTQNSSVNSTQNSVNTIENKSASTSNSNPEIRNNSNIFTNQNMKTDNNEKILPAVQKNNTDETHFINKKTVEKETINKNQPSDRQGIKKQINTNNQAINNSVSQLNNSDKNQFPDPVNNLSDNLNINNVSDLGSSNKLEINANNSGNSSLEKIYHLNKKGFILPYDLADRDIFNDTILNIKGEQIILKSKFYAVDAFWSSFMHQSIFSGTNPETQNFSQLRNDAVKPVNGFECFGINFNMNNKHFLIQAGISITKINDEFTYASLLLNPKQKFVLTQNNNPYNFIDNGNYFLIDTPGGYWHYTYVSDSMIHVSDSAWVNIIDTNLVSIYDSTLKTVYDTLKNKKLRNSYSYFEIPIMVGYEVSYKNFDFALKAGIITSFLISTSGNNTTYNTGELNSVSTYLPFRKVFFSGIISVSVNYKITDHWGVYIEPYYRQSLAGLLRNNNIMNQQVSTYGARFGVRYKF